MPKKRAPVKKRQDARLRTRAGAMLEIFASAEQVARATRRLAQQQQGGGTHIKRNLEKKSR